MVEVIWMIWRSDGGFVNDVEVLYILSESFMDNLEVG